MTNVREVMMCFYKEIVCMLSQICTKVSPNFLAIANANLKVNFIIISVVHYFILPKQ